ncbi:MAG TPA: hypothetical protein VFY24_08670 [Azospira sp.]|nr:hypothetical protein [Azospira sp.]
MHLRPTTVACAALFALALTGCAGLLPGSDINVISYQSGERWLNASFYLIEHPFSDDGSSRAKARADQLCGSNQRIGVQSERTCSLEKCTTQYVCMKPEDAKAAGR